MYPDIARRVEGLAVGVSGLAALWWLDASLLVVVALALAPDLSMLGYLAGPRIGARVYNLGHVYLGPLALGALGVGLPADLALVGAIVWAVHIGLDRAIGYGLKFPDGFGHTDATPNQGAIEADAEPR
jgi:hypothetical protein